MDKDKPSVRTREEIIADAKKFTELQKAMGNDGRAYRVIIDLLTLLEKPL